jgi:hypothetical protein
MVNYSAKISTSGGLPWNYIMSPKTTNQEPGVVVYSLIPALRWLRQENGEFELYNETLSRRSWFKASPGKMLARPYLNQ